jgi:hypothetical protein
MWSVTDGVQQMPKKVAIGQLKLRLPITLRKQLEEACEKSGKSLNHEILWRLERSFEPATMTDDEVLSRATELAERLQKMITKHAEQTIPDYKQRKR